MRAGGRLNPGFYGWIDGDSGLIVGDETQMIVWWADWYADVILTCMITIIRFFMNTYHHQQGVPIDRIQYSKHYCIYH